MVIAVRGDAARRGQGAASDEVDRLRFEGLLAEGRRLHCPHTGPFVSTEQDSGPCLEAGHGTSCYWALQEVAAMATAAGFAGLAVAVVQHRAATAPARHDEQGR